jgi:hypothetical protein
MPVNNFINLLLRAIVVHVTTVKSYYSENILVVMVLYMNNLKSIFNFASIYGTVPTILRRLFLKCICQGGGHKEMSSILADQ